MGGYNYLLVLLQTLIYEEWKRRVRDGCKYPSHINFLPHKPHQSRGGFFLFPFLLSWCCEILWKVLVFWGKRTGENLKAQKKKNFLPCLTCDYNCES